MAMVGRLAFALPFAVFGIFHFMNAAAMARVVPVPGGVFWVYLTGAAMLCAAVGIVSGLLGKWASYGIALLMLMFIVFVHVPSLALPELRQMALQSLLKDTSLLGGALGWAYYFAEHGERRLHSATGR